MSARNVLLVRAWSDRRQSATLELQLDGLGRGAVALLARVQKLLPRAVLGVMQDVVAALQIPTIHPMIRVAAMEAGLSFTSTCQRQKFFWYLYISSMSW